MAEDQSEESAGFGLPVVVSVVVDLFFGVKIAEAAKRAGGRMISATSDDDAMARAFERPALIVIDLQERGTQPFRIIELLKSNPATASLPILGFFPHVQEELRRSALAAGCDMVLPRSVFVQRVDELIEDAVQRAQSNPPHRAQT